MTPYDDDLHVSSNDLPDVVAMAMVRQALRALVPDVPPAPSAELAAVLRDGLPAAAPDSSRLGALTRRLAGFGVATKLLLATGVAVAGVGGAATAVVISHGQDHHGDGVDSPRNHPATATPNPSPSDIAVPAAAPTSDPGTAGAHDGARGTTEDSRDGSVSGDGSGHDGGTADGSGDTSHDGDSGTTSGTTTSGDTSPDGDGGSTSDSGASPQPTSSDGGSSDGGSSDGGSSDSGDGSSPTASPSSDG
jgi:hypothetical protein